MSLSVPKVLVLNADYRAHSVCNAYKAFVLVYMNKAETVTEHKKETLKTISSSYPIPSVIRLHKYINIPYKGVMLSRTNIFKRDNNQCVYCGSKKDLTLDHVIPRSKGGPTTWTNLVTACKQCNSKKGDFDLEEMDMTMSCQPYKPSFVMFLREFSGIADDSWQPYLMNKPSFDL